jgi:hypothetical protein
MPKPRQRLDSQLRQDLYLALERKTSINLKTKTDCAKVSALMIHEGFALSASTLYRIFISNKSQTRPFTTTLNEIAHFLGFKSFDDFSQWAETNRHSIYSNASPSKNSNNTKSLLSINIELKNYDALKVFFDQYLDRFNDAIFFPIGREIYCTALRHPESVECFIEKFAGHPVVRRAFFELYADPDFHIQTYDKAIEQYIAKSHSSQYKISEPHQAEIFGRTLLLKNAINKKDKDDIIRRGSILYSSSKLQKHVEGIHFFPKVRYYLYKIAYLFYVGELDQQRAYENELSKQCDQWAETDIPENRRLLLHTLIDLEEYVITPNLFSEHKLVLQHKIKTEQNIALNKLSKKEVLVAINPNASAYVFHSLRQFQHLT